MGTGGHIAATLPSKREPLARAGGSFARAVLSVTPMLKILTYEEKGSSGKNGMCIGLGQGTSINVASEKAS